MELGNSCYLVVNINIFIKDIMALSVTSFRRPTYLILNHENAYIHT